MSTFSSWVASFVERELLFKIDWVSKLNAQFESEILSKNDLHSTKNVSVCDEEVELRYRDIDFPYSLHVSNSQKKNENQICSHK